MFASQMLRLIHSYILSNNAAQQMKWSSRIIATQHGEFDVIDKAISPLYLITAIVITQCDVFNILLSKAFLRDTKS